MNPSFELIEQCALSAYIDVIIRCNGVLNRRGRLGSLAADRLEATLNCVLKMAQLRRSIALLHRNMAADCADKDPQPAGSEVI